MEDRKKRGSHVYALNTRQATISVFKVEVNGSLSLIQVYRDTKLPLVKAQGMAII